MMNEFGDGAMHVGHCSDVVMHQVCTEVGRICNDSNTRVPRKCMNEQALDEN
jgi:putative lipase involved disintegration of autophagic bodies